MSNPYQSTGSGSNTLLTCFGIGCGGILLISLLTSLAFSGAGAGSAMGLIIVALVIILIVSSIRKSNASRSNDAGMRPATPVMQTPATQTSSAMPASSASYSGDYASPICSHKFTKEAVYASKQVTCDCGNTFQSGDLIQLQKLAANLSATQNAIYELRNKMAQAAKQEPAASAQAAPSTYVAAPKPKVVKPKPERQKINLSLQQWLIIGASVLVLVSGIVFVSTNIGTLPQWVFELITVGVAAATGFGAFKSRNISVLLSNFLAAFSSSMQLATMTIIGDQLSPNFEWNTAPAWWWAVSLGVVSAAATALAKFSKNFGFKGMALLGSASATTVLSIGVLRPAVAFDWAPIYIALACLFAALLLAQNRFLRSIKADKVADKALAAYVKDLAEREDTSLRILGLAVGGLQLLAGIGLTVLATITLQGESFNWFAILSIGIVWAALTSGSKFWIDQVKFEGASESVILLVGRGIVFASIAAAINFEAVRLSHELPLGSTVFATLAIALISLLALFGLVWFSQKFRAFSPNRVTTIVAIWLSLAIWVLWSHIDLLQGAHSWVIGCYAIAFAALLSVTDLRFNVNRYDWGALVVNGAGVVIIAINVINFVKLPFDSLAYAAITMVLVTATAIQLPLRHFVNEKQNFHSAPMTKWVAFFFGVLVSLLMLFQSIKLSQDAHSVPIAFAVAFILFSVAMQAMAIWSRLAASLETYLVANHYLGQAIVALLVVFSISTNGSKLASTNALLIAALAIVNYGFGTLQKQALKMQLGFTAAIAAFLSWQFSVGETSFLVALLTQVTVILAATWLHTWFLRKRTELDEDLLVYTPVVAISLSLFIGWGVLLQLNETVTWYDLVAATTVYGVAGLLSASASKFGKLAKVETRKQSLGLVGVALGALSLLSNLIQPGDFANVIDHSMQRRLLLALVISAAIIWIKNYQINNKALVAIFYILNLSSAFFASDLTTAILGSYDWPESYSLWFAFALVGSTLVTKVELGALRRALLIDVPIIATAAWSAIYAAVQSQQSDVNTWRGIIALGLIAGFAYFRTATATVLPWLVTGYLTGVGSAIWLANGITHWLNINFEGPEIYSVLATASVAVGNLVLVKRFGNKHTDLRLILTVGGLILPSLIYSFAFDSQTLANELRALGALAIAATLSVIRIDRSNARAWSASAYLTATGAALASARLVSDYWLTGYNGPEIYTALAAIAIALVHLVAIKHLGFKTTMFRWGLPIGVALFPSILFTYSSLDVAFDQLSVGEIVRMIAVLIASAALLIHGSRAGNLGTSTMGLAGLALVAIPNTAMHSDSVVAGSSIDSTSMVIAVLVFTTLALLRKYTAISGNSLLFIGLPIAIALAPALVQSLAALASPTLGTIDWWRFSIVLASGMTLLIVGTLREVAGLFYPGLLSVLLSALPYGFRQTEHGQWSLWVLLLLVAAVMVWLAVRLERLKRAGRNSATWLKELK